MNTYISPRLRLASVPLAVCLGLGGSACGVSAPDHNKSSNIGVLSDVRLIGAAKDGYINAVNGGEQAEIYSSATLLTIGKIIHNEAFEIVCVSVKPNAFAVQLHGVEGKVNLADTSVDKLSQYSASDIPDCK